MVTVRGPGARVPARRTAERARAFVAEHFTLERVLTQTLDVYRELVPKRG